jgi:hypothetical protein
MVSVINEHEQIFKPYQLTTAQNELAVNIYKQVQTCASVYRNFAS